MADMPYIGEIRMLAFQYPPIDWMLCDGRLMQVPAEGHDPFGLSPLYSLIGTKYGGDGKDKFALPNLEPNQGVPFYIAFRGTWPVRP